MTPTPEQAARRNLRHELAFIIDSTIDMPTDKSDRDTLLMRLEAHVATLLAEREAAVREECAMVPEAAAAPFEGCDTSDDLRSRCDAAKAIAAAIRALGRKP